MAVVMIYELAGVVAFESLGEFVEEIDELGGRLI